MIFILVFCAFTVLLFGCFSRKFVQVAISGFSTFTCATSTSTPPHKPTKVSIDSLWPTCTRYYRIWGPVCFNDELSTDDVRVTSKIAFWTFSLKYLQSTISTRDFITKPSSKYLFITAFDELYNGVLQLCNLWKHHTVIELRTLHLTFTKKKALCSNVYIELSGHL